jgi:short-subunit dehydrogenase
MQGVALLEGPMPVMPAAEVARQGYAALKAERPQIIAGHVNRIIAMSTRFTPTSILLMIASHALELLEVRYARGESAPKNIFRKNVVLEMIC